MDMPESQRIRVAVQEIGPVRRETLMGREYTVVPATLVRSQVLNNNVGATFLPPDAFTAEWADAWNGTPVVIDHPSERGQPISARQPNVLNRSGVGTIFGAKVEGAELKAEVWIERARAEQVQALEAVLGRLDQNQKVELSTGFAFAPEPKMGTHEGQKYDMVMHPIGADHLALLVDAKGACSLDDGCGLGVNCDCHSGEDSMDEETVANSIWEKMRSFFSANSGGPMKDREKAVNQIVEATGLDEEYVGQLDDEKLKALHEKLADARPGDDPEDGPEGESADGSDEGESADDGPSDASVKATTEALAELKREMAELKEAAAPAMAEQKREKEALVKALAANERVQFEKDELKDMTLSALQKLDATVRGENYAGKGGPRSSQNSDEPDFIPVSKYWETDQKEDN